MILSELNGGSCKTYLIADEGRGHAVLVDPLYAHVDRYIAVLAYHRLQLDLVIDTHTHAIISGCPQLRALIAPALRHAEMGPSPAVDVHLDDGEEIEVGDLQVRILHTPGHTPDGMSLLVEGNVLTGDTLFIGGSGRTDFAGGDAGAQFDAVTRKLFTLPDDTVVRPGHDYRGNTTSTIGREKQTNPRLANRTRRTTSVDEQPSSSRPPEHPGASPTHQSALGSGEISFSDWSELKKVRKSG